MLKFLFLGHSPNFIFKNIAALFQAALKDFRNGNTFIFKKLLKIVMHEDIPLPCRSLVKNQPEEKMVLRSI